jgi:hypothetical protein
MPPLRVSLQRRHNLNLWLAVHDVMDGVLFLAECVVGLVLVVVVLLGGNRFYLAGSWGFFGNPTDTDDHIVSNEQFARIIEWLLSCDRPVILWVSLQGDKYGGVVLSTIDDKPTLSVSFKTHAEREERARFKLAMANSGYENEEDSRGFNGGAGEQHRVTHIEFPLSPSSEETRAMIDLALSLLEEPNEGMYHVSASFFAADKASFTHLRKTDRTDPIANLLSGDKA